MNTYADRRYASSLEREDRIVLIRHRLVGDKALAYRLLSRAAYPRAGPDGLAFTRTPRTPDDEGPPAAMARRSRSTRSAWLRITAPML